MKNTNGCKKMRRIEENARRAFAHTHTLKWKEGEREERQTRFIYSNNQPPGNTHTCLTATTRINTLDDYQNRRKKRMKENWESKRIRRSVTNRMCNEADSIRCCVRVCVYNKNERDRLFPVFESKKCFRVKRIDKKKKKNKYKYKYRQ